MTQIESLMKQRKILLDAMKRCIKHTGLPPICERVINESVNKCKEIERQYNLNPEINENKVIEKIEEKPLEIGTQVQIKTDRKIICEIIAEDKMFSPPVYNLRIIKSIKKDNIGLEIYNISKDYLTTIIEYEDN